MANEEQLSILKQGVEVWNEWREENPNAQIDLGGVALFETKLVGVNLSNANLEGAELFDTDFSKADFRGANLRNADLSDAWFHQANFKEAILIGVDFWQTDLYEANLSKCDLRGAQIVDTHLQKTDFSQADLSSARISTGNIDQADFSKCQIGLTTFSNTNLSKATGLEDVIHQFPSTVGTNTLQQSLGRIPEVFLRGCGLSDWEIEMAKQYNPELRNDEINQILYKMYDLRATQALQISPLFVSYSHADSEFVDKIGNYLSEKGVRYWRDIHNMKAGRIEKQIDNAISQNRTVLLVLSEHSIKSDWVEHEVRTARGLEKDMGRDVLCPIALDDSWKSSPWPKRVMEQIMEYNILDFSAWKDDVKFEGMFRKLIDGLELFYKG